MTLVALLRHGVTAWNRERRVQGRTDIPLCEEGRAALAGLDVPPGFAGAQWWSSPLARARETARLLGHAEAAVEPRLVEMAFGAYEGLLWHELGARDPDFADNELRGLDFLPPGGESPRMVQARLGGFFADLAGRGGRHVALTHKGVIRAVLAQAWGWDMLGRQPEKLDWRRAQVLRLDARGRPAVETLNLALVPK